MLSNTLVLPCKQLLSPLVKAQAEATERLQAAAITSVADLSERSMKLRELVAFGRQHTSPTLREVKNSAAPLNLRSMTSYSLDKALQGSKSPSRVREEKRQTQKEKKEAKQREKERRRKEAKQRKGENLGKTGRRNARRKSSLKGLFKHAGHGTTGVLSPVSVSEEGGEGNLPPKCTPEMAKIRGGRGVLSVTGNKRIREGSAPIDPAW
jgi:hypothetical protein